MSDRHEFDVGSQAALDARIESGSIEIRNGDAGRVVVEAPGTDDWVIEATGDLVSIRPVKRWRSRSAHLAVELPEGARVAVRSAAATVRLTGVFGETSLQSASGDLVVGSLATVTAATASGGVRIDTVEADATLSTASGRVEIGRVGGRLSVSTASGDVRATCVDGDLRVGTASGDVRVDRTDGAEISVKSVSGDVEIGLPSGIRVEPDLTTLTGRTRLPSPSAAPADDGPRRVVRVTMKTVSGDITIHRAD